MTDYLIGISKSLLFLVPEVSRMNIDEETDSIELYGKDKKLKFFANKIDTDFVSAWNIEDEIPESMQKIYSVSPEKENGDEEQTPEEQTPEEPNPEPQGPSVEGDTLEEEVGEL